MSSKDDCKKEKKNIAQRNQRHGPQNWVPSAITQDCYLHRLVLDHHYNEQFSTVELVALEDARFSVFVEGGDFPPMDIAHILRTHREQYNFVAAFKFPAKILIDFDKYEFLHDPHPFEDKYGEEHLQHPNHAQVICQKDLEVAEAIRKSILAWIYDGV